MNRQGSRQSAWKSQDDWNSDGDLFTWVRESEEARIEL